MAAAVALAIVAATTAVALAAAALATSSNSSNNISNGNRISSSGLIVSCSSRSNPDIILGMHNVVAIIMLIILAPLTRASLRSAGRCLRHRWLV